MAKTIKVTLSGTDWNMPASYKASREIAEKVGDPLSMAIEAHKAGTMTVSTEDVVSVIAIGVGLAGCSLSRDDIGEAITAGGLVNYVGVVGDYIGAIVSGQPEKSAAANGGAEKK